MMETVVEVSTECGAIEEESFPIAPDCEPAAKKRRGGENQPLASKESLKLPGCSV